jgi:hypothetical protein
MLPLLVSVAFAAEPAELGAKPPSGADLTRIEDGAWLFERTVEIDGVAVSESGIAQEGHIQSLTWTASGRAAEVLASWHAERAPEEACSQRGGERLSVRAGVAWRRTEGGAGEERWVAVEESEVPYASCEDLPQIQEPAPKGPPPPTAAPVRAFSSGELPYGSVVRDPPAELARRIHVQTTELSELPVRRIVGWCLATWPATGVFRWESGSGIWRSADRDSALGSCVEALLAPMLPRGEITVEIDP